MKAIAILSLLATALLVAWKNPPKSPPPPPPPPAADCDHSVMAGKDGEEGNDDCARAVQQPPAAPPPAELRCPAGMSELGRAQGQVLCAKTVVVTRVSTKVVVRKAKPRTVFKLYCPKPRKKNGGLAG